MPQGVRGDAQSPRRGRIEDGESDELAKEKPYDEAIGKLPSPTPVTFPRGTKQIH